MSRIHDERKDIFNREGVLTSSANIRSIRSLSLQTMEKEKTEKSGFNQHNYDSGFRAIDLLKPSPKQPQGRNIVPVSIGSAQLHAMPPLMPSYISGSGHLINPVPINPSSLIQLPINQIPSLPTIIPPVVNRSVSPIVTSHGLPSDTRLDHRTPRLSEQHHTLRGNFQASCQHGGQATIQVIASGTAVQPPQAQSPFLSKSLPLNTTPNMLKIGVTANSNTPSSSSTVVSAFKLGKGYPNSSNVLIPATTSTNIKADGQDNRHSTSSGIAFARFSSTSSGVLVNHIVPSHPSTLTSNTTCVTTTTTAVDPRSKAGVGAPFHPISGAYVFHDIGHPIGVHNFHPQLIQTPVSTVANISMFTIESQRALSNNTSDIVAPVASKTIVSSTESHDSNITENLNSHRITSFNIPNIYPNLQPSNFTQAFSTTTDTIESSARPSILRKRPAETSALFPVQPTEKERVSSPLKMDHNSPANILQTRMISPPSLKSSEKGNDASQKSINHSILSITSDLKENAAQVHHKPADSTEESIAAQQSLLTSAMTAALNTNSNLLEVSPKKKPRKQLIITNEDKYGTTAPINPLNRVPTSLPSVSISPVTSTLLSPTLPPTHSNTLIANTHIMDEDEEFLKANETMKDITPPKLPSQSQMQAASVSSTSVVTTHAKALFAGTTSTLLHYVTPSRTFKQETKPINNAIVSLPEMKRVEQPKYYFNRRPQISILNDYKRSCKAVHNHFYRYSDVRIKDEKKLSQERILTKSSLQSLSGWRIQHLSSQLDEMMSLESEICTEMFKCRENIPLPKINSSVDFFDEHPLQQADEDAHFRSLHELLQGNIQRCRYGMEQLDETKQLLLQFLEHKPKAVELIKKYKKPRWKKKQT